MKVYSNYSPSFRAGLAKFQMAKDSFVVTNKKEEAERISVTKVPSEVENQKLSLGAAHKEVLYLNFKTANFDFLASS